MYFKYGFILLAEGQFFFKLGFIFFRLEYSTDRVNQQAVKLINFIETSLKAAIGIGCLAMLLFILSESIFFFLIMVFCILVYPLMPTIYQMVNEERPGQWRRK